MPLTIENLDEWIEVDECWTWKRATTNNGYGALYGNVFFNGRTDKAHRAVWQMLVGEIPAGLFLDHMCRNTRCVNPDHLRLVTPLVNSTENVARYPRTHCKRGHAFTERMRGKQRLCWECVRLTTAAYEARRRAAAGAA